MLLTVSNKFWMGEGGRWGGSSAVMLLNRTSAVMLFNRTGGRINHRCIHSYTLFPSLTVVYLSASPFPSHYYTFFLPGPWVQPSPPSSGGHPVPRGCTQLEPCSPSRGHGGHTIEMKGTAEVNGRVLKAWNCEEYTSGWANYGTSTVYM